MNKVASSIRLTRRDSSATKALSSTARDEPAGSLSSLLLVSDDSRESAAALLARPSNPYEIASLPRSSSQPKLFKRNAQSASCRGSQEPGKKSLLMSARKPEFFRIVPIRGSLNTVEEPNEEPGLARPPATKLSTASREGLPVSSASGKQNHDCLDLSSCLSRPPAHNNLIFIRKPKLSIRRTAEEPSAENGFAPQTPSRLAGPVGRSKCVAMRLEDSPSIVLTSAVPVSPLKSALRMTQHHRERGRKPSGLSQRSACISTSASIEPSARRAVAFSSVLQIRVFSCNA